MAAQSDEKLEPTGILSELANGEDPGRRYRQTERKTMKATQLLHNLGQSIWLDNITRDLLNSGTLKGYIADLSVTDLLQIQQS